MQGKHFLKAWGKKQQVVALSSAESELYAGVRTAVEGLGHQNLLSDMGMRKNVVLHLDSSSALCVFNRKGLGKMKHIELQHMWVQDSVKQGRFITKKVPTNDNPADLMTKALPADKVNHLVKIMGFRYL